MFVVVGPVGGCFRWAGECECRYIAGQKLLIVLKS